MNKKIWGVLSILFVSILLFSSLAIAQSGASAAGTSADAGKSITKVWDSAMGFLNKVFSWLLGDSSKIAPDTDAKVDVGEIFVMKVLFFIIFLTVVLMVVKFIPVFAENTWAGVIISIAVSVLGIRFLLTPHWIQTILLPYTMLGVAVTAFIPLLIYFFFVERMLGNSALLRKGAWILGAVVFAGLYISRYSKIGETTDGFNPALIYLIAAVIFLLILIFDKQIRVKFVLGLIRRKGEELNSLATKANQDSLVEWYGVLSDPKSSAKQISDARKNIKKIEAAIARTI